MHVFVYLICFQTFPQAMFFWGTLRLTKVILTYLHFYSKVSVVFTNPVCFTGFLPWSTSITCFPAHLTQPTLPNSNHWRICQSPASSLLAHPVALAKRLSKEPWGCWQKGVLPLSQLAHLRYVLPTNLPMCDRASRSAVVLQLLPASFNSKNLPQLNAPQSKASHLACQPELTTLGHARRGEKCMEIWFGMFKVGMVVKAGIKMSVVSENVWLFSGWMYLFFWQLPALADRHWKRNCKKMGRLDWWESKKRECKARNFGDMSALCTQSF